EVTHRMFVGDVPGVQCAHGFKEKNVDLIGGNGVVLNPLWNDEELPRRKSDLAIAELDHQATLEDEEQLVGVLMTVPDEFTLELRDLHVLTVELTDDAGAPMFGEVG